LFTNNFFYFILALFFSFFEKNGKEKIKRSVKQSVSQAGARLLLALLFERKGKM
jgi:hypothetical protein